MMSTKKPLKLHWSGSKPNFGDCLSPLLCERISGRAVVPASFSNADLVAVGSLLQRKKESFFTHRVHVWGTGFIASTTAHQSRHYYHALRGKYSAGLIKNITEVAYGDPGLLIDRYFPETRSPDKRYRIGLVAHYKDKDKKIFKTLCDANKEVVEIDIFAPVTEFLQQLTQCEVILSSAMHGLIAADSFGIPNGWIKLADDLRGDDFKFKDYYSIFGTDQRPPLQLNQDLIGRGYLDVVKNYSRPGIEEIKTALERSFPFI